MSVLIPSRYSLGGIVIPPVIQLTPFPVTTLTSINPVPWVRPANHLGFVTNNSFGHNVKITRVSASSAENATYFPNNTASNYIFDHGYNTRQAWSRNGTYLRLGNRVLCDGLTYAPQRYMDSAYKLWSNAVDDKMYVFYSAGYVRVYRPSTGLFDAGNNVDLRGIAGIDAAPAMTVGYFEGNFSNDDSRVILNIKVNGLPRNILVNLLTGEIIWNKSDADFNTGVDGMNTISVTQSGLYIITNRYSLANGTSLPKQSFNIDGTLLNANLEEYSHREAIIGSDGIEYLIGTNNPIKHNLITGVRTELLTRATMEAALQVSGGTVQVYGGHSSGRMIDLPDWMSHSSSSLGARYKEQMYIKTDGSELVMRLCDAQLTDNRGQGPQGTPSRDGKRFLFASDVENANGSVDAYVVEAA